MVQPPWVKPPDGSSSGPPGACITPSRLTKVPAINFLMELSFPLWQPALPYGLRLAVHHHDDRGGEESTTRVEILAPLVRLHARWLEQLAELDFAFPLRPVLPVDFQETAAPLDRLFLR